MVIMMIIAKITPNLMNLRRTVWFFRNPDELYSFSIMRLLRLSAALLFSGIKVFFILITAFIKIKRKTTITATPFN